MEAAGDETEGDVQNLVREDDLRLLDLRILTSASQTSVWVYLDSTYVKKRKEKKNKNASEMKPSLEGTCPLGAVSPVLTCPSGFRRLQLPQPSRIQGFLPG